MGLIVGSVAAAGMLVMLAISVYSPRLLHQYVVGSDGVVQVVEPSHNVAAVKPAGEGHGHQDAGGSHGDMSMG